MDRNDYIGSDAEKRDIYLKGVIEHALEFFIGDEEPRPTRGEVERWIAEDYWMLTEKENEHCTTCVMDELYAECDICKQLVPSHEVTTFMHPAFGDVSACEKCRRGDA